MDTALVLVTHNRLEYTKKTVARLLADPTEEFELFIWDNASTDGTAEYLRSLTDSRIQDLAISSTNVGQSAAMNHGWGSSQAALIGKLDNDCLVTPGWTRTLAKAHAEVKQLGAIACWHFQEDDFDEGAARCAGKIHQMGTHQILRHPWVCGSGFIMKREAFQKYGPWLPGVDVGTTYYFKRMALDGWVNGWYYPFILQEHMDDPRSSHSLVTNDEGVKKYFDVTYTLRTKQIYNMEMRWERRKVVLENLNSGPWQAESYAGMRAVFRRLWNRARKHMARERSRG